ncbi:MAG TPA: hypothetical protein VNC22_12510 [Sporichthya sp.]|jgi:hypothetical protein|nr:hypothetical protein [Sporichthya sp.]
MIDRLRREHGREVVGIALVIAAAVTLAIGYANIRDEIEVAIQLPYVLSSGVGAVILTVLGVGLLRSSDDKAILRRMAELETTNSELAERVGYLTQLIEVAILPDDADAVAASTAGATAGAATPAHAAR